MPQALRMASSQRMPPPRQAEELDEAVLVALAQADRQHFATLYRRYVDRIYRYCDRCLGDRDLAEDATSLIFTKALAALPHYHGAAFRSWLFTIAHNVIVDCQRARVSLYPLDEAVEIADHSPVHSPEASALAGDDARTIRALLAQLVPDQRQILELRLAGLADAEIAAVLGRSHGAVRMSQHRAIARMRELVGVTAEAKEARHDPR